MILKPTGIKDEDAIVVGLVPAKWKKPFNEDDIRIIEESVFHANMNLYARYGIWVEIYEATVGATIKLKVYKTKDYNIDNIGHQLSGISRYIKKNYPNVYEKFKVGCRLFSTL